MWNWFWVITRLHWFKIYCKIVRFCHDSFLQRESNPTIYFSFMVIVYRNTQCQDVNRRTIEIHKVHTILRLITGGNFGCLKVHSQPRSLNWFLFGRIINNKVLCGNLLRCLFLPWSGKIVFVEMEVKVFSLNFFFLWFFAFSSTLLGVNWP